MMFGAAFVCAGHFVPSSGCPPVPYRSNTESGKRESGKRESEKRESEKRESEKRERERERERERVREERERETPTVARLFRPAPDEEQREGAVRQPTDLWVVAELRDGHLFELVPAPSNAYERRA